MDNNEKKTNRPLDQEELSPEQEAKIAGGLNIANLNTANFNPSSLNTPNFNASNINPACFNTANIGIPPKA